MATRYGFDSNRLARIGDWMQSYVDRQRFAGASCLIHRSGKEVYFDARGHRNQAEGLPFTRETLVRIYSMTKPVTSVALMMLAERGVFHLDAPISDFLPEFSTPTALVKGAADITQSEPCAAPTLHQLLTHTSGLSYPFNPGVLGAEMEHRDIYFRADQGPLEACLRKLADLPLAFHPGARWEYSVGIDVIGRVIEIVSGKSLDRFFADEIFAPLGMTSTAFSVPAQAGNTFASLYTPLAGSSFDLNAKTPGADPLRCVDDWRDSIFLTASTFSGGGGLVSTIDDYMRFAEMLRRGGQCAGGHLLSPQTVDFMTRNHLPGEIASMGPSSFAELPMQGMGFGLGGAMVLDPARARTPGSVGDFGWGGMASTYFWVDPVLDLSAIFFTQLSPSSSYPNRPEFKALVHGAFVGDTA